MRYLRRLAKIHWLEPYEWYVVLAACLLFAAVIGYGGL